MVAAAGAEVMFLFVGFQVINYLRDRSERDVAQLHSGFHLLLSYLFVVLVARTYLVRP
jgi:hypothetical protein